MNMTVANLAQISRCSFAKNGKEMYENAELLFS